MKAGLAVLQMSFLGKFLGDDWRLFIEVMDSSELAISSGQVWTVWSESMAQSGEEAELA